MTLLEADKLIQLSPQEIYSRTQSVLEHFGVPAEAESQSVLAERSSQQTLEGLQAILPIMDPDHFLDHYIETNATVFTGYQDRDSKELHDFVISLLSEGQALPVTRLETRLKKAATQNPANLPLKGLKIALDPGHMGNTFWDEKTGKIVYHPDGRKLSEGVLNLQTVLLLEKRLTALGAEVLVTHRELGPVSALPLNDLPLVEFARRELRSSSADLWFQALLKTAPIGNPLYAAFEADSNFNKLFAESHRADYFILRADLDARTDLINRFAPDLTLIIHYDTMDPEGLTSGGGINKSGWNRTKVYVPGSFSVDEFSSREDRAFVARHLTSPFSWDASRKLGRSVVRELSDQLGLEFDRFGGGNSRQVEPGIFSRNLALNRKIFGHAVSYVEVAYYNDPKEFNRLHDYAHDMDIGGKNYPYSERLVNIADALENGVVKFVQTYR